MRIISWNINGIRTRFGELRELAARYRPDFICLQKVRCDEKRGDFKLEGYRQFFEPCDFGKWSGVTVFGKIPEDSGRSSAIAPERYRNDFLSANGHMQAVDCGELILVNAYVPFANKTVPGAEEYRKKWDLAFRNFIGSLTQKKPVVICGDLNIVHTINDTCESRLEQNRPCFYKWERENFNSLLEECELVDIYRELHPDAEVPTFYGNYRHTGLGNRIDYFLISRSLMPKVKGAEILTDFGTGQSVPITLELNYAL